MTAFKGSKGTSFKGGLSSTDDHPVAWTREARHSENGIFSGLDWFPTLVGAAGNPNITEQLLKDATLDGRTYKNHLDGSSQMALLEGKGPSARHELFYFSGLQLGALRVDDFKFPLPQQP